MERLKRAKENQGRNFWRDYTQGAPPGLAALPRIGSDFSLEERERIQMELSHRCYFQREKQGITARLLVAPRL